MHNIRKLVSTNVCAADFARLVGSTALVGALLWDAVFASSIGNDVRIVRDVVIAVLFLAMLTIVALGASEPGIPLSWKGSGRD